MQNCNMKSNFAFCGGDVWALPCRFSHFFDGPCRFCPQKILPENCICIQKNNENKSKNYKSFFISQLRSAAFAHGLQGFVRNAQAGIPDALGGIGLKNLPSHSASLAQCSGAVPWKKSNPGRFPAERAGEYAACMGLDEDIHVQAAWKHGQLCVAGGLAFSRNSCWICWMFVMFLARNPRKHCVPSRSHSRRCWIAWLSMILMRRFMIQCILEQKREFCQIGPVLTKYEPRIKIVPLSEKGMQYYLSYFKTFEKPSYKIAETSEAGARRTTPASIDRHVSRP